MHELELAFEGRSYGFGPDRVVRIGRRPDSDIVVADPTVSREQGRLSRGPDGWLFENIGRAPVFVRGQPVVRLVISEPVELRLASPTGPAIQALPGGTGQPAGAPVTAGAAAAPVTTSAAGESAAGEPAVAEPQVAAPTGTGPAGTEQAGTGQAGTGQAGTGQAGTGPAGTGPATSEPAAEPGVAQPGMFEPGTFESRVAGPGTGWANGWVAGPTVTGAAAGHPGMSFRAHAVAPADELVTALHILIPVRSWLRNPGWRQGLRLLVIAYGLLPLVFLVQFATSQNLATPGWLYSLYIAPLWAMAFWLLIRPGQLGRHEVMIGVGVVVWVLVWIRLVTAPINAHLNVKVFPQALLVGLNEEAAKALPILLAALLLLKIGAEKLDVRKWMFLGTIAGLTFGVSEQAYYTSTDIVQINKAVSNNQAIVPVLSFAERVFVDGFQHAVWAGVAAFFIGMAVNYPRRRIQLVLLGVAIPAVLHALNDWIVSNATSLAPLWLWICVQAVSLLLFIGYTMSAAAIEERVRQTPLFRGDSIVMERILDERR